MSDISILTTNVFPGHSHLRLLAKNLGVQTHPDFEWVLVDALYDENKTLVSELIELYALRQVLHVPACHATHIGRQFDWSGYNTALLLSSGDIFFRLGVYRYCHHRLVESVLKHGCNGIRMSLLQRYIDGFDIESSHEEIVAKYGLEMDVHETHHQMFSHCGMFSMPRQQMLDINGNNECLCLHHWEDVEFNSRWVHLGRVKLATYDKAFLRLHHNKDGAKLGKPFCTSQVRCPAWTPNNQDLLKTGHPDLEWFDYRGFPWCRCPDCGAVAVGSATAYFEFIRREPKMLLAPIGVGGTVGRDIRILDEDLKKLTTLESKLELLTSSHTNPRYLCDSK